MIKLISKLLPIVVLAFMACNTVKPETKEPLVIYPEQEGFLKDQSDSVAISIADSIMLAQGGIANWDSVQYVSFNFFGARKHFWDKYTGDIRIEGQRDDLLILMNIHSKEGRVFIHGVEQTSADSLTKFLEVGEAMWVNDTYWLTMPYKLKDSGTRLNYLGETKTDSVDYALLQLSYDSVGITPENRYVLYVDKKDWLVKHWDYFAQATDSLPALSTPWVGYESYEGCFISADKGFRKLSEIQFYKDISPDLRAQMFTQF